MKEYFSEKAKKRLFNFLLVLLVAPLLLMKLGLPEYLPLKGAVSDVAQPKFTIASWYEETYQPVYEDYVNVNFGFRPFLVRLNNQISYSFFNKVNAQNVVIGKENFLYEENYIRAYLGIDFIGKKSIEQKVLKLQLIQDTLRKLNKDIFVVFAPGKASFFPEYIPDSWKQLKKDTTNYEVYVKTMKSNKINFLDFNKWFREMKGHTTYPLYPKAGIHWSSYGEYLAADSLVRFISELRKTEMPQFVLDKVVWQTKNNELDYDIGGGMNLMSSVPTYPMGYPQFRISRKENKAYPKVLVVSDSYYWGMYGFGMSEQAFSGGSFWYYNNEVYPDMFDRPTYVSDLPLKESVESNDVILLMSTDANLEKFAFGFIDALYDYYFDDIAVASKQRVKKVMNGIRRTPEWFENIKAQALKENISVEEALRRNAEYVIQQQDGNKP